MPARIVLADGHEIARRGLRAILSECAGWEICGEAANGRQAVEEAKRLQPDLVVMDLRLPELNGLSATRKIRKESPRTEVLILASGESEPLMREALDAGARGFIQKSGAARELIAAVEALLQHKVAFSSQISEIMLKQYLKNPGIGRRDEGRLTPREYEITHLLAEGKSNKDVAMLLRISVKTAETHRSHIMTKLNLGNLSELVLYAVRNHIVQL